MGDSLVYIDTSRWTWEQVQGDAGVTTATARDVRVHDGASESVRRAYELFVETIGPDDVEDLDSFRLTVSAVQQALRSYRSS